MSIQAMAWVLEESRAEGLARLVLLAIANHADARGWNAWPSVAQIAREARVSRSTVFRCLLQLTDLGELEVTESGGGRGLTTQYRLPLKGCQADTLSSRNGSKTVSGVAKNGVTRDTRTVLNREPARTCAREGAAPPAPSGPEPTEEEEPPGVVGPLGEVLRGRLESLKANHVAVLEEEPGPVGVCRGCGFVRCECEPTPSQVREAYRQAGWKREGGAGKWIPPAG